MGSTWVNVRAHAAPDGHSFSSSAPWRPPCKLAKQILEWGAKFCLSPLQAPLLLLGISLGSPFCSFVDEKHPFPSTGLSLLMSLCSSLLRVVVVRLLVSTGST